MRKITEQSWREIGIESRNRSDGNGFWLQVIAPPAPLDRPALTKRQEDWGAEEAARLAAEAAHTKYFQPNSA